MYYQLNKIRSQTKNHKPTKTDQSAAKDTDINVIVKQFTYTGQAPGAAGSPLYADFTQYPQDLRGFIETARSIETHRKNLPAAIRDMPLAQLLVLTPDELRNRITPAPTPPAPPAPGGNAQ